MWNARHLQRHDLLGAHLLGDRRSSGHPFRGTGDDHLARSVEVGDPDVAVGSAAGHFDLVVVEPEHRCHGADVVVAGVEHGIGSLAHQPHAFVEPERTGGGERGVLAEAVTGAAAGLDAQPLDGVEHHQAGDEGGELSVAGVAQLVGVGVEQQPGDIALGHLGRLCDQFPAVVVGPGATHARPLRALAREGERKHDAESVDGYRWVLPATRR